MPYDRAELIQTYLNARGNASANSGDYQPHRDEYNDALREYYQGLLAALEQLFEVELEVQRSQAFDAKVLLTLLRSTADSYLTARTPWSQFQETSLLVKRLDAAGENGRRVLDASDRIEILRAESDRQHLDILDAIAEILLGDRAGLVFESADLTAAGFDAADRPDPADYPSPDYEF